MYHYALFFFHCDEEILSTPKTGTILGYVKFHDSSIDRRILWLFALEPVSHWSNVWQFILFFQCTKLFERQRSTFLQLNLQVVASA